MTWLGYGDDGRERWRGTGFSIEGGGMTWIVNLQRYFYDALYRTYADGVFRR